MIHFGSLAFDSMTFSSSTQDSSAILWARVPMEMGLSVIYGLNGSGKSLILEGIEEALTGIVGDRTGSITPRLLVRIDDEAVFTNEDGECEGKPDALAFYEAFSDPDPDFALIRSPESGLAPGGDVLIRLANSVALSARNWGPGPPGFDYDAYADEVVAQKFFSVRATGASGAAWSVKPVAEPNPGCPWIEALRTTLDEEGHGYFGEYAPLDFFWDWIGGGSFPEPFLPELYEPSMLGSWPLKSIAIKVFGGRRFDADAATWDLIREIGHQVSHRPNVEFAKTTDTARPASGETVPPHDLLEALDPILAATWSSASRRTAIAERYNKGNWLSLDATGGLRQESGMHDVARTLESLANRHYSRLLMDAPILTLRLGSPSDWATGTPMTWGGQRSEQGQWVAVQYLSEAERKWACVAIELALALDPNGVLLIDEPEQALHRSAEAYMANGLKALADEFRLAVIVASHSPELLNQPDAHVHLVRRRDQGLADGRQVVPLTSVSRDELAEYGLLPSDLLRMQRGFLLVEGQHDLIVLRELLGDELDRLRIELLPMRGAGRLRATLDSRVLYDFTDAHMFVMLDALNSTDVSWIWNEAVRYAKTEGTSSAIAFTEREFRRLKADEAGAMSAFLTRALERGLDGRHTPLTLSALDILDYLPVAALVPGATSWTLLRQELASAMGGEPSGTKFKDWLKGAKGANLTDQAIREAAESLDRVPEEFTQHLERMRTILAGG